MCAAALALPDGREHVAEGRLNGTVVRAPRGSNGFGYDPVFVPEGGTRTTSELTDAEKDAISHRGRALRALVPVVRDLLAGATTS
jgi:XTP/dITP diphosphohydrolase